MKDPREMWRKGFVYQSGETNLCYTDDDAVLCIYYFKSTGYNDLFTKVVDHV